jgi:hypothetical protein
MITAAKQTIGPIEQSNASVLDLRFAQLLGPEAWHGLPPAIRRRFSKRATPDTEILYRGQIEHTRLNHFGHVLAQAIRPIGAPLPLHTGQACNEAVVTITGTPKAQAQRWTRCYSRGRGRRPQTITSTKTFGGPTGCEEWITPWLSMALDLRAEGDTLFFESQRYVLTLFGRRLALPKLLSPGAIQVGHTHMSDTEFRFTLTLTHPWFGRLVDQAAVFRDIE